MQYKMKLTEKEKTLIDKIERREKFIVGIYVSIGILFVAAISLFILGWRFQEKSMFLVSLYFITVGLASIINISIQRKLYFIIKRG